jgi:cysteinyl-tRNA synthetase
VLTKEEGMIKIYNTMTKKEEEFIPIDDKIVKMYVCGITPYDSCHIGHARCYVTFDIVRRFLEFSGYKVFYVQNFTDIDDKIIKRSNEKNISPKELADKYINEFFDVMGKLNIKKADLYPRVTENIDDIIKFVKTLIDKKYAYVLDGDVYYRVRNFKNYGKLSGKNIEDLEAGARVEVNENKEDPLDFALWKSSKEGEIFWESPWGHGRPGWHIECSSMSTKYLGATLDIHGGGSDLIFPHHENEIAQTESYTDKKFVNYWIHNGFVMINKEKMSKSLGNFFTLNDVLKKYDPMVVRIFLTSQHYRSQLDFSIDKLDENKKRLEHFIDLGLKVKTFKNQEEINIDELNNLEQDFVNAMNNDFNSAIALSVIHKILDYANKSIEEKNIFSAWKKIEKLGNVLGISFEKYLNEDISDDLKKMLDDRELARKNKNWQESDRLRKELEIRGITVEDTPKGQRWKKERVDVLECHFEGVKRNVIPKE